MNARNRWIWGLGTVVMLSASSCTGCTTTASKPKPKTQPSSTSSTSSGSSYSSAPHSRDAQTHHAAHESGHRFVPRAIDAHPAPPVPAPIAAHRIPAFVDGAAQCFPSYRRYSNYSSSGSGIGSQGVGRGGGGRPVAPAPRASAAPKPKMRTESPSGWGAADGRPSASSAPAREAEASRDSAPRDEAPSGPRYEADEKKGRVDSSVEGTAYPERPPTPSEQGFGAAIYLSNDDTMSLSSAQRVIYAIDQFAPLPAEHVRPHELLNYFSFQAAPASPDRDFSVLPSIFPHPEKEGIYTLGLAVSGRPLTAATRRNANLSFVIDRSGSMSAEGRMEYLKRGLLRSLSELKQGDIVGITLFDSSVCQLAQNFVVGRDSPTRLRSLIEQIVPTGSTNLHDGLQQGYQVANQAYQNHYTNRVIMVTDALTNTGVTNNSLISMVGKHYDDRRIRLSGVGVGRDFNDELLDQLTERGKGAYVFLGSEAEVDAVFGPRFTSLIETVANDVHFRLHLPPSLAMDTFYGEEASTQKERVQAIHYFANTSQMFLSDLKTLHGRMAEQDDIMLTIEYEDPETGTPRVEEYAWNLGQIASDSDNLKKARLIDTFARSLGKMASRGTPARYSMSEGSWFDQSAAEECRDVGHRLETLAANISYDPEVERVRRLWSEYCRRYASYVRPLPPPMPRPYTTPPTRPDPGPPVRNNDFAPRDEWPSASR